MVATPFYFFIFIDLEPFEQTISLQMPFCCLAPPTIQARVFTLSVPLSAGDRY